MVAKSKNGNFICVILNFFYILFEYIYDGRSCGAIKISRYDAKLHFDRCFEQNADFVKMD